MTSPSYWLIFKGREGRKIFGIICEAILEMWLDESKNGRPSLADPVKEIIAVVVLLADLLELTLITKQISKSTSCLRPENEIRMRCKFKVYK